MRIDVRHAIAGVRKQALAGIGAKEFSATIATLERVVDNLSNGHARYRRPTPLTAAPEANARAATARPFSPRR
jgi:hypothetical protein